DVAARRRAHETAMRARDIADAKAVGELMADHVARTQDLIERQPDADMLIERAHQVPMRQDLMVAVMHEPNSHDVTLHLMRNPQLVAKLNQMEPGRGYAEVARIAGRLEARGVRRPSSAPPPIAPVSGGTYRSSKPMEELSYQEYRAAR